MSTLLRYSQHARLPALGLAILALAACGRTYLENQQAAPELTAEVAPAPAHNAGAPAEPASAQPGSPSGTAAIVGPGSEPDAQAQAQAQPGLDPASRPEPEPRPEAPSNPKPRPPKRPEASATSVPSPHLPPQFRPERSDRSCQQHADCQVVRGPGPGCCDRYALNATGVERLRAGKWLDKRCRDYRCRPQGVPTCVQGSCIESRGMRPAPDLQDPRVAPTTASLDQSAVDRQIQRREGAFDACHKRELGHSPGLSGEVEIEFTVQVRGNVTPVEVTRNTTGNDSLAACIRNTARRLRFNPAPESPAGPYRHRFQFSP